MNEEELKEVEDLFRRINRWDANGNIVVPFWCPLCERHRSQVGDMLTDDLVVCKDCYNECVLF